MARAQRHTAQGAKVLAAKPGNLGSIVRTHAEEGEIDSQGLSSDLHTCIVEV